MHTKEYYINILKNPFIVQSDIPIIFLSDNDITQLLFNYKWSVVKQDLTTGWASISKIITRYD